MKRWRIALVLGMLIVLAGAVVLAGGIPLVVHGPFPLDRPLESSLSIRWDGWNPVTTQVIPEGCMGNGFKTWLIVYNSTDQRAWVSVVASGYASYFTSEPFAINPHQRMTIEPARYFTVTPNKDEWTNPDVSFQVLSDTPGVYAQVTMISGTMGYTSQGFFK